MKKIALLFILFTLISCEQIVSGIIENAFDTDEQYYTTYLKIENTSNYQLDNILIHSYSSIMIDYLAPSKTTNPLGGYGIIDTPYVRFYINNKLYEQEIKEQSTTIESGNYILKITILSTSLQTFKVELIEDEE